VADPERRVQLAQHHGIHRHLDRRPVGRGAGEQQQRRRRGRSSVFLSTNALAATVGPPSGVTFANITRNLPNRAVTRVAFDPIDPTVIYVALSGFGADTCSAPRSAARPGPTSRRRWTFRTTASRSTAGHPLGDLRRHRSGDHASVDGGFGWTALDPIHFPNSPVTDLQINQPAGVLRASTFGRGAFELSPATGPVISINAQNGLDFGTVCAGEAQRLTIQVFNVGTQDLVINSVQRLLGSARFSILANPATPVVISPDAEVDFTVEFDPTGATGSFSAQIRISSNDPGRPISTCSPRPTSAARI